MPLSFTVSRHTSRIALGAMVRGPAGADGAVGATGATGPAGSGSGDVTGQSSSVDNEIVLFSGTGGKTIKQATGSGFVASVSGVFTGPRTLTAPAAGLTISNPAGAAGNPTFALANGLASLESLTATGIVRQTSADNFTAGTLVTNAELANMAQATIKGRTSGAGTGAPVDLTAVQATAILNAVVGDSGSGGTKGLVPAPSAGDAAAGKFLKADGTWSASTSADMAQSTIRGRAVGAGAGAPQDLTATQATAILDAFTGDSGAGGVKGAVPAPAAGDSTKFLKGNGTWAALSGSGDMLAANNLSDVASAATSFSNIKQAASETATGVAELATTAECVTGTDTARAVTPAGLTAGVKARPESFIIAASDETTVLTTGTNKVTFRMPYALTVTGVKASLSTGQTSGNIFTVDINDSGTTILSTKLTIDNGEKTSVTAVTPAVISDTALAADAEITIDIDQIGDGTARGLKVTILGTPP